MNTVKTCMIAIATLVVVSGTFVSTANAGNKWKKPLVNGLGIGVGIGIVSALTRPRAQTYYVQQPAYVHCGYQNRFVGYDGYGRQMYQRVQVCN